MQKREEILTKASDLNENPAEETPKLKHFKQTLTPDEKRDRGEMRVGEIPWRVDSYSTVNHRNSTPILLTVTNIDDKSDMINKLQHHKLYNHLTNPLQDHTLTPNTEQSVEFKKMRQYLNPEMIRGRREKRYKSDGDVDDINDSSRDGDERRESVIPVILRPEAGHGSVSPDREPGHRLLDLLRRDRGRRHVYERGIRSLPLTRVPEGTPGTNHVYPHSMVLGEPGSTISHVVDDVAMEYKLTSYRVHLAGTNAILDLQADVMTIDGDEIVLEDDDDGPTKDPRAESDPRLRVVYRLVKSEKRYQEALRSTFDVYAEPLRKFSSLTKDDHRVLFFGLEPLLSLSAMLVLKLEDTIQHWGEATTIGNLFSKQFWHHYDEYFNGYKEIRSLLRDKRENDEEFVQFCLLRRGNARHSLEALLFLPVQRVPSYASYLSELLEDTEPNHPDYDDLSKATAKVKAMECERKEQLRTVENEHQVEGVQDRFPHDDLGLHDREKYLKMKALQSRRRSAPGAMILKTLSKKQGAGSSPSVHGLVPDLANAGRTGCPNTSRAYIHEGPVQITNGLQTQDRYLFLFSDLFLVAKQKSNTTFKLKHRIRVCELWLASCIDDVAETSRAPDRSFVLGWPTTNVVLTFSSQDGKDVWYNKLKEQISSEKEREQPKTVFLKIQNNDMEGYPTSKTLTVTNYEHAEDTVKRCIDDFHITDGDYKDYQLWVLSGKEESAYPLIGHEEPFSIKMSHVRDVARGHDDTPLDVDANDNTVPCQFILRPAKKDHKTTIDEPGKRNKKSRRSPMIPNFFNRKKNKHESPTITPPSGKLFSHSLCEISEEDAIPKPIMEMLHQLFTQGPFTSGIFRKSANQRCCRELREKLDNEEKVNFDDVPIIVIAGTLKDFLRNLPDCLFLSDMYDSWIDIVDIPDSRQRVDKVKKTLEQLPKPHVNLLRHVMCMLYHINQHSDVNQMTSSNLAICISQSLLFPPRATCSTPSQTDTKKVSDLIQFMVEHVTAIFGDDVITLFGEAPDVKTRPDSSTDSESMHSLLSYQDNHGPRRDDSSIDSLDRDAYNSETESSPRLLKSHHSNTNLSRDSGLTLSDTQLYNEDTGDEYPRVMTSPNKAVYGRSVSQMDDQPTKLSPDMLSRSYDGALESIMGGQHTPPVPPPRKNRRRGAEPPHEHSLHAQIGGLHPAMRGGSPGHRLPKSDSLGSLDEYTESAESGDYTEIQRMLHSREQTMLMRKSESGAHLYMNEQLMGGRWASMPDEDSPMINAGYDSPLTHHRGVDLIDSPVTHHRGVDVSDSPLTHHRGVDLSASYPGPPSRQHEVVFTVTPPDSPDMPLYSKSYHHAPPPYPTSRSIQVQSSQSTDGGYESSPTLPTRPTTLPLHRPPTHDTTDSSSCENSPALGGSGRVAMRSPMDFQRDPTILRKVQKGMTPTGADFFPKHMRNMMRHSLQEDDMKKVLVGRERSPPVKQSSAESYLRPDSQPDRRQVLIQMRQSRAVEKSASDSAVMDCFHSPPTTEAPLAAVVERRQRPDKPPSYQEAMKRKSLIQNGASVATPTDVIQQRVISDRARQLYEESIRRYNEEKQESKLTDGGPGEGQVYETMIYTPDKGGEESERGESEVRERGERGQSEVREEVNIVHVSTISSTPPPPPPQTTDKSHEAQQSHRQSPADNQSHRQSPSDQSHRQSPCDNQSHRQSSSDNQSHRQSPSDKQSHRQSPSENQSHRQQPSDNQSHRQSPSDNQSHRQLPSDNQSHRQSPSDNQSHRQLPSDNQSHRQSPSDNQSHRQSPSDNQSQEQASDKVVSRLRSSSLHSDNKTTQRHSSDNKNHSRESTPVRRESTPVRRESTPVRRESTPVRRNHSHERVTRDNRNNQNERPKSRSKSRDKRHGHRSSDTRLENSRSKDDKEFRHSNLSRSKSDSQEHLNKTAKFKELKPLDSNIIERCKRAKMEDGDTGGEMDDKPKRIQSVKHRDWHRELAEKYNQVFYQPDTVPNTPPPQYAYIKSTKQEANEKERPKRRWTPPIHPSKDLILKSGEDGRGRKQTPPRTVVKCENDYRNGQQYENARKNTVAEKENRPSSDHHRSTDHHHHPAGHHSDHHTDPHTPTRVDQTQGDDFTMGDSNKISWSVARLRNLYDENKGDQTPESTGPFYNPSQEGSRPPPPPYRHPPPITRTGNSNQRRCPTEKTNPEAEESYV